jgi:hypothetical protein
MSISLQCDGLPLIHFVVSLEYWRRQGTAPIRGFEPSQCFVAAFRPHTAPPRIGAVAAVVMLPANILRGRPMRCSPFRLPRQWLIVNKNESSDGRWAKKKISAEIHALPFDALWPQKSALKPAGGLSKVFREIPPLEDRPPSHIRTEFWCEPTRDGSPPDQVNDRTGATETWHHRKGKNYQHAAFLGLGV